MAFDDTISKMTFVGEQMKFELNDYNRNISDEEILKDIKITAQKLGKDTLTTDEYTTNGSFHHSTVMRRFGSWKKALQLSGLETKGHNFQVDCSIEDAIADIKNVAFHLKKDRLTANEYDKHGTFSSSTLVKKFGSWNKIVEMAELYPSENRNFSNDDLLCEIERIWILLGRQPTSSDIKKGVSKYSLQSYARHFGGWRAALETFVAWVNDDNNEETSHSETVPIVLFSEPGKSFKNITKHTTSRDINLRLRFRVMQRDNFKCCACGASPAKDPSVVLHVDHIIPWSKGGETVFDNLQTLCSDCNLGKSDIL